MISHSFSLFHSQKQSETNRNKSPGPIDRSLGHAKRHVPWRSDASSLVLYMKIGLVSCELCDAIQVLDVMSLEPNTNTISFSLMFSHRGRSYTSGLTLS